jgi:hypothetical protein
MVGGHLARGGWILRPAGCRYALNGGDAQDLGNGWRFGFSSPKSWRPIKPTFANYFVNALPPDQPSAGAQ